MWPLSHRNRSRVPAKPPISSAKGDYKTTLIYKNNSLIPMQKELYMSMNISLNNISLAVIDRRCSHGTRIMCVNLSIKLISINYNFSGKKSTHLYIGGKIGPEFICKRKKKEPPKVQRTLIRG
jgi:hypothetical protein